jgi:drug/metabolite transporter (DMT)-like permease
MSDPRTGSLTLRPAAAAALLIGALLLLASWDGLYDTLDLPQPLPALAAQLGGAALIGLAYLLWRSASRPELAGVAAGSGAIAQGGGALVIAGWLIFRDRDQLGIDTLGVVVLIVTAVVLAILALAQLRLALASR